MAYAEGTSVPIEKSLGEIIALIKKAGASRVMQMEEPDVVVIQFFLQDRLVRFKVELPQYDHVPKRRGDGRNRTNAEIIAKRDQLQRQRARALLLVIKAKVESIESNVETFEQAFLANIVTANGHTLYERVQDEIALEYDSGAVRPLMLGGPRG